jgi:hypothetical protein
MRHWPVGRHSKSYEKSFSNRQKQSKVKRQPRFALLHQPRFALLHQPRFALLHAQDLQRILIRIPFPCHSLSLHWSTNTGIVLWGPRQ